MGLAASQARMLLLIARKSDLELGIQNICSKRIGLASKTSNLLNLQVSNDDDALAAEQASGSTAAKTLTPKELSGPTNATFDATKIEYNNMEEFYDNIDTDNDGKMSGDEISSTMDILRETYGDDPFVLNIDGNEKNVVYNDNGSYKSGGIFNRKTWNRMQATDKDDILLSGTGRTDYRGEDENDIAIDAGGSTTNFDGGGSYYTDGSEYDRTQIQETEVTNEGYVESTFDDVESFMDLIDTDDDETISDEEKENALNTYKSFDIENINIGDEELNIEEKINSMETNETYEKAETSFADMDKTKMTDEQLQAYIYDLQQKDKILELQSETLEVQHEAVSTEYDSVEKVIENNIKKSFGTFKT